MSRLRNRSLAALRDVRFWILLFLLVRLHGITNPPLEVAHNWRQTTVAAVARNFLEVDADPLHPRIDIEGEKSGISGMEFPLLAWLTHLPARLLGHAHWYGRLVNLLVSSLGVYAFHELVRARFGRAVAFPATLVLLGSLWFSYSRKIMPDTFSTSLALVGLWLGVRFVDERGRSATLALSALALSAGVLAKLPAGFLVALVPLLALERASAPRRRLALLGAAGLAMLPPLWWYFVWVPALVREHGSDYFFLGVSVAKGAAEIAARLPQTLERFYETALKYLGFAVFLLGLARALRTRDRRLLAVFAATAGAFLVVVLKAGLSFPHHTYYVVPFVPVMALVAGYGLASLRRPRWRAALLALVMIEGVAGQLHDFRVKPRYLALTGLEEALDSVTSREELVLINGASSSTPHYFAHRRGWSHTNEQIADPAHVAALEGRGLAVIVILKRALGTPVELPYEKLLETEDYVVLRP